MYTQHQLELLDKVEVLQKEKNSAKTLSVSLSEYPEQHFHKSETASTMQIRKKYLISLNSISVSRKRQNLHIQDLNTLLQTFRNRFTT